MDALDKLQRCTTPGIRADFDFLSFGKLYAKMQFTPEPRPLKKGTFDSNAAISSEGSGDMSSTQSNQI